MPMIGDLQAFSLPDLLRTLGSARQSGQLSVWSQAGVHRIWLHKGSISAAIAPQPDGALKEICLKVMDPNQGKLVAPLSLTALALSEAFGDWLLQRHWLTEDQRRYVFESQLNSGLYPLFELASGQFYFVGDMVPLPYAEMTGLELPTLDAIAQGLDIVNGKGIDAADLPGLGTTFITIEEAATATFRLSLLDKRLLQWFRKPNTIQSLCQVLQVESIELQKACRRLLHLRLIKSLSPNSFPTETSSSSSSTQDDDRSFLAPETESAGAQYSLIERIATVLNTPIGKSK
jgi:hypothetical protein